MDDLILVKASKEYQNLIEDMLKEWKAYNSEHPEANKSPWAIFYNYKTFDEYLYTLNDLQEHFDQYVEGKVPASTYFALDTKRNMMVGAVNIRHYLNEDLRNSGGHIGDGIRPSERRKGYGTKIIALALEKCKELGIEQVMISCSNDNIGSRKAIINNGGVFERFSKEDDETLEIYWIKNY